MAETEAPDRGAYEVLRDRLRSAAGELGERTRRLNAERVATFGGGDLELVATDRLRTERDSLPRDLVRVGGALLLGYRVPPAPGQSTGVAEVFRLYRQTGEGFTPAGPEAVPGLLDDPEFQRDFADLFRYFQQSALLRLRTVGSLLLAVFRTGERVDDIRVLRWKLHPDGRPEYVDAKGERDHVPPDQDEVAWTATTRDDHVPGAAPGQPPHIDIDGTLRLATAGGTLRLAVQRGPDGEAEERHSEPLAEPLQSLADAQVHYARVGPLLLLRVLPYNETEHRHLVHNTRTGEIVRLDGLGQGCRVLPEDQGVIFPGGYYLSAAPAGSAARTFDLDTEGLAFERLLRSPNGEDLLYVFRADARGRALLLPYNLIDKAVRNPIPCLGFALFDDGRLVVCRAEAAEASRVHPVQLWATPFASEEHAAAQPAGTGPLARIGNADLVRGISDAFTVVRMVTELEPDTAVFEAVVAACDRLTDQYHWLGQPETHALAEPVATLRATAEQVIAEYERVRQLRRQAAAALAEAEADITGLVRRARGEAPRGAADWVTLLTRLRRAQGHLAALRDTRHIDTAALDRLDATLVESLAATGRRAVAFLSRDDAFDETHAAIAELTERAAAVESVVDAEPLAADIAEHADELRTVTEVIGTLEIADAVVRTELLTRIGEVTGAVNRARAVLDGRRRELLETEGRAEFAAEYALLGQAVTGALASATTPEECDEHLGRLLLTVENLEARFGTFDEFLAQLADQREEIYETFAARKQAQLDERARHAERLAASAERVLDTVGRRAGAQGSLDEINAYFAADPLVARVRATADELRSLGEEVRADEIDGRLTALRQEAGRTLRDRAELFGADGTIRLGRHHFTAATQPIDLTLVPHDGGLAFAVTGTDYRAAVADAELAAARHFWDQPLASESPEVYRAEHLAASVLAAADQDELARAAAGDQLTARVRRFAEAAYDEGYDRGVHDHDAARILAAVLRLREAAGLLRYPPRLRACAQLFWAHGTTAETRRALTVRAQSLARARATFGATGAVDALAAELTQAVGAFLATLPEDAGLPATAPAGVGGYLLEELAAGGPAFVTSPAAGALRGDLHAALGEAGVKELTQDLAAVGADLAARHQLVTAWLTAFTGARGPLDEAHPDLPEAAALELTADTLEHRPVDAPLTAVISGLLGSHPRLERGELPLRLDEFLTRTDTFRAERVPAHRAYVRRRNALLETERRRLRLESYRPRVMPAFVRNRLLDEVYLPLVGDNLAKQLGAAGDQRRTDSQGLLLLLSPPGYGKTTLMEYVAARLGMVFVKVDGPALGHHTTSLDPAAAPDAAARREIEKLNFALEMGNNVLLHLDDIQHTSPELLQRFIPLCDAQRRIDGVRASDGEAVSHDLRGKRFAVVMAGNPFTESGHRFRVPDMLANRADVWNLGEVLTGREELFALSHIENALTANPTLAPLASRDRADIELLVRLARGDETASAERLRHPYTPADLEQILAVLRRLLRVRDVMLKVNAAYIASATQEDATRTEPPFRLQGSYRNTNQIAERIVPVLNDEELEALIDDHYRAEAQTLTTGAEANLLKLAELRGRLTPAEAERWAELRAAHAARAAGGTLSGRG
ncbi:DNA repair ATPase [Streptomyces sp. 3MP-14]|uniref:DNA repair ATPase n=1 Tax=Streptomyces mimosae TaxID=2586635 RepID=A0A5N6A040_9ACTN|nr:MULTISPECIES: DNA repair ATPase [Streptomyces]KAB8161389.1 DNA repair ATPase [Streptomyces mimosae]KAB8173287.1 DNA repair ATPase [Streptomyces sp. 3MP-14]